MQFFDEILYNILLLFEGLFISGGLKPLPKWPIASASPVYHVVSYLHNFNVKEKLTTCK